MSRILARIVMRKAILPLLAALGVNAVPAAAFFGGHWSASQTMLLYLFETFSLALLAGARVRLLVPAERKRGEVLQAFAMVAGGFTGVSALFVTFFLFAIVDAPVNLREVASMYAAIVAVQLVLFVYDLFVLRPLPLDRGEKLLEQTLGRVFLLSLSVFAGVVLALFVERWFVVPFMVLKTIVDVGTQLQFVAARSASASPAQS